MRLSDYFALSFSNLWKRKLRTFLTVFGVTIGIGALVLLLVGLLVGIVVFGIKLTRR